MHKVDSDGTKVIPKTLNILRCTSKTIAKKEIPHCSSIIFINSGTSMQIQKIYFHQLLINI